MSIFSMIRLVSIAIFAVVLIGVLVVIIKIAHKQVSEERANDREPQQTEHARVVTKRTAVYGEHSYTTYFVTFELDTRERLEMKLSGEQYGMLAEGDDGMLTHQGTRYLDFQRV